MTSKGDSAGPSVSSFENRPSYPGWRVAVVCHIGVVTGFAAIFIYSFSFMSQSLHRDFGWNSEQIARGFSLAVISVAVCSPMIGKLFDRYDPSKLIAGFMAAFGLGIGSLAFLTPHLAQFYVTAIFIGIAGTGTYQLGYARIVAAWFERRLGAALALVVAGSGVGSFFVPPLVQHSIAAYGWRNAYLILAALPLLVGVPLTLLFAQLPQTGSTLNLKRQVSSNEVEGTPWREAVTKFSFWLLALGACALSLSENGALAHLAPMLSNHGLRPREIALTASLLGASNLAGRFVLGSLLDYIEGALIAVGSLLTVGAGILFLAHARTFSLAAPSAFVAGLGCGCELDLIPYMLRRYFGMRAFSTLYGLAYSAFASAAAVAPLMVGHFYDSTGSYTGIFDVLCAITLVSAFAMLALPAYRLRQNAPRGWEAAGAGRL
ncbi:MAG: MFS transporter [Terracidiphilus sp.]